MSIICSTCQIEKPFNCFHKNKTKSSGYQTQCIECKKKSRKKTPKKNKITKSIQTEISINDDENKICINCKENKKKSLFYKDASKKSGYSNTCASCTSKRRIEYRKNNVNARIKHSLRSRLYDLLKGRQKNSSSLKYLDCSISYFKKWIEFQFEDWMSWDNYGEWHCDHVKPCNSFNFQNENEIFECFNWSNYQPLRNIENKSKGSKILLNLIEQHNNKIIKFKDLNTLKEEEGSTTR
jgi:hypothetical protein